MTNDDESKVLDFVKGLTKDLVQGNQLQQPERVEDKVFQAALANLRNFLAEKVDENNILKKKNEEMDAKVKDLKNSVKLLKNDNYHSTEMIEKLRDNIDLKESNQRILEHEMRRYKETFKDINNKHNENMQEYDGVANEMKLQIDLLEQKNSTLNATLEHLRDKTGEESREVEKERGVLYQNQITYQQKMRKLEEKSLKMRLDKKEFDREKGKLSDLRASVAANLKDFEKKLEGLQIEKEDLEKNKTDFKTELAQFQKEKITFKLKLGDLEREKDAIDREKTDFIEMKDIFRKEKNALEEERLQFKRNSEKVEKEKEDLYRAYMSYEADMEDFERALGKYNYDKAELSDAYNQLSRETAILKKARENFRAEQHSVRETLMDYQGKVLNVIEQLSRDKKVELKSCTDNLTLHLLSSLEKVDRLQNSLEEKMNKMESRPGSCTPTHHYDARRTNSTPSRLNNTNMPVLTALPIMSSSPITSPPDVTTTHIHSFPKKTPTTPEMLYYGDLTSSTQFENSLNAQDDKHVSFKTENSEGGNESTNVDNVTFCNVKEHSLMTENIERLRKTLLKDKSGNTGCDRNDLKWDLCRLEAKVGDAVLKRSLYLNSELRPRT